MQGQSEDRGRPTSSAVEISLVVPVFDEAENIERLVESIFDALRGWDRAWELIFVDDGSTDGSRELLEAAGRRDQRIRIVPLMGRHGQTAALTAGFDRSRGEIMVTLDADLQNDPRDIPALVAKLDEGYAVVSGWRRDRQDARFSRIWPSYVANKLIRWMSRVDLHDIGCTLKAYRRDALQGLRLYGEMHRFVPIYASWNGAKIAEMPVRHNPRAGGQSKYGLSRIYKVVLDLLVIKFLEDYHTKPIHVFGGMALLCLVLSGLTGLFAVYLRVFEGISFILTPLPLLVVTLFTAGLILLMMGLLAEILIRVYFESQGKLTYRVNRDLDRGDTT